MHAAERHLSDLRKHHPAKPAESLAEGEKKRRIRRMLEREAERMRSRAESLRQARDAPYRPLGWLVASARLRWPPTIGMSTAGAVSFVAIVVGVIVTLPGVGGEIVADRVEGLFLGGAVGAAVVALWGDLIRNPFNSWRIRRRIVKRPWCVLPTTAHERQGALMARDARVSPIVPRRELYDELLPGVLDRSESDTQVVVGQPGSGKTTALVDISKMLARIGLLPVVVPLWGKMPENIVNKARERFVQHGRSIVHSEERLGELWEWLRTHHRVVILVDDLDRIAPDGDRGFLLRRALGELAAEEMPAVITTRPAGIPAGVAASAINLEKLSDAAAARHVLAVAREQPGTGHKKFDSPAVRGNVELWIKEGRLAEVPFYLELLARLVAAERCEELAPAATLIREGKTRQVISRPDGQCEWNPLWVRFRLLECFHEEVAEGTVHRWLGIDERERQSCLRSLSEAALAQLVAVSLRAQKKNRDGRKVREDIQGFLDANDRAEVTDGPRSNVSAHEVVNTAERLRMLDRDPDGGLHFSHRILQAYFAGCYLAQELAEKDKLGKAGGNAGVVSDRLGLLLDTRHPERMTANMTLVFAALRIARQGQPSQDGEGQHAPQVAEILDKLVAEAEKRLPKERLDDPRQRRERQEMRRKERLDRLDPLEDYDPEEDRADPDDALAKLTTAAEIIVATGTGGEERSGAILDGVECASGATRWTKLNATPAIAALRGEDDAQWTRIWEFARDPDHEVRRAASQTIADDASHAYAALKDGIDALIVRAALKSSRDLAIDNPAGDGWDPGVGESDLKKYGIEKEEDEVRSLKALGWVLPAIVSGLREHPTQASEGDLGSRNGEASGDGAGKRAREDDYDARLREASLALDRLISLAFQERFPALEEAVAQGFKNDAMRHLETPVECGPGRVESNRQLVSDICLGNARSWYARLALHQALALYTVGGSDTRIALDVHGRASDNEPHPLAKVGAKQARRAVVRASVGSDRWKAFVWADEGDATSRRQPLLNPEAAMLVADVTLMLNLKEMVSEDRQRRLARMNRLPHCLCDSRDRLEILGSGCPDSCAYGFCPLKEAPVDEPVGQRTISRAFCRGLQSVSRRRAPSWQRHIRKGKMVAFWREMETRART